MNLNNQVPFYAKITLNFVTWMTEWRICETPSPHTHTKHKTNLLFGHQPKSIKIIIKYYQVSCFQSIVYVYNSIDWLIDWLNIFKCCVVYHEKVLNLKVLGTKKYQWQLRNLNNATVMVSIPPISIKRPIASHLNWTHFQHKKDQEM
jgi:hypothetical protein